MRDVSIAGLFLDANVGETRVYMVTRFKRQTEAKHLHKGVFNN